MQDSLRMWIAGIRGEASAASQRDKPAILGSDDSRRYADLDREPLVVRQKADSKGIEYLAPVLAISCTPAVISFGFRLGRFGERQFNNRRQKIERSISG